MIVIGVLGVIAGFALTIFFVNEKKGLKILIPVGVILFSTTLIVLDVIAPFSYEYEYKMETTIIPYNTIVDEEYYFESVKYSNFQLHAKEPVTLYVYVNKPDSWITLLSLTAQTIQIYSTYPITNLEEYNRKNKLK